MGYFCNGASFLFRGGGVTRKTVLLFQTTHCMYIYYDQCEQLWRKNKNTGSNYVWLKQDCNLDAHIIFKSECDQFYATLAQQNDKQIDTMIIM